VSADLALALGLADHADEASMHWWRPDGVGSTPKADGSPVTAADVDAERAVLQALRAVTPDDGFLGEEIGERFGSSGRRWIVDGIDGTRFFAAGERSWGTLIALETAGVITVAVISSPAQDRRWWAVRGGGAFTGVAAHRSDQTRIRVSTERHLTPERVLTLPGYPSLSDRQRQCVERIANGVPAQVGWSHQVRVAEGKADVAVWFGGDTWDHAAPSLVVHEAGGRFSDHNGGQRLDTRTAVYSNGLVHKEVLATLAR
jgi:histidinol-phosphatase